MAGEDASKVVPKNIVDIKYMKYLKRIAKILKPSSSSKLRKPR